MKTYVPWIILLLISISSIQGQTKVEKEQLTINFLLPGVVYEVGLSPNSTLAAELTTGYAIRGCTGCNTEFGIYPIGRVQYRYYYNMNRRLSKNKNISGNSGNYLSPTVAVQSGKSIIGDLDYTSNFFLGFGAVYGLQRTSSKGFNFRFETGPAYFFDEFDNDIGLFLAIKLGWVVRKRK